MDWPTSILMGCILLMVWHEPCQHVNRCLDIWHLLFNRWPWYPTSTLLYMTLRNLTSTLRSNIYRMNLRFYINLPMNDLEIRQLLFNEWPWDLTYTIQWMTLRSDIYYSMNDLEIRHIQFNGWPWDLTSTVQIDDMTLKTSIWIWDDLDPWLLLTLSHISRRSVWLHNCSLPAGADPIVVVNVEFL